MAQVQVRQQFTNPFSDVQIDQVQVAGESIASKIAVRVKADDGTWSITPAILSSDYKLINNAVARDVSSDIMSRSGHEWQELKTMWDGKKYVAFHITKTPLAQLEGNSHPIHMGLMVRNSYDGSGVFGLELYACNMHCTNQYHDRNRFGYFAIRHDSAKEFDVQDALQNLSVGAQNVIAVGPHLAKMRALPLEMKHLLDAKKNVKLPVSYWGDVLDRLALEESTMFGLYQAFTWIASHDMTGINSISVGESISQHLLSK
jgi:hypothetical protein